MDAGVSLPPGNHMALKQSFLLMYIVLNKNTSASLKAGLEKPQNPQAH